MTELEMMKEALEIYRKALEIAAYELNTYCDKEEKEAWGCFDEKSWQNELYLNAALNRRKDVLF